MNNYFLDNSYISRLLKHRYYFLQGGPKVGLQFLHHLFDVLCLIYPNDNCSFNKMDAPPYYDLALILTRPFHTVGSEGGAASNDHYVHLTYIPNDFFLGDVIKNNVYEIKSQTVAELKQ